MAWQQLYIHAARARPRSLALLPLLSSLPSQLKATNPPRPEQLAPPGLSAPSLKRQWFGGCTTQRPVGAGERPGHPDLPPFGGALRGEGCAGRERGSHAAPTRHGGQKPQRRSARPEAHTARGAEARGPRLRAPTPAGGAAASTLAAPKKASASSARGTEGQRPPRRLRPLQRAGPARPERGREVREVRAPRTSARPSLQGQGRGGEGSGREGGEGRRTGLRGPACARAPPKSRGV